MLEIVRVSSPSLDFIITSTGNTRSGFSFESGLASYHDFKELFISSLLFTVTEIPSGILKLIGNTNSKGFEFLFLSLSLKFFFEINFLPFFAKKTSSFSPRLVGKTPLMFTSYPNLGTS